MRQGADAEQARGFGVEGKAVVRLGKLPAGGGQKGGHAPGALVGRILLALIFVQSGWEKLMDLGGTAAYVASAGLPFAATMVAFSSRTAVGCVMVTERSDVQPFRSVTVQVQVPAVRLVAVALVCAGEVFQLKVYGAVPPFAAMVALPVACPKQPTLVCALMLVERDAAGWVMTTFWLVVHPLASVTVQVQVPAPMFEAVAVV